jgi:hypothetical protein
VGTKVGARTRSLEPCSGPDPPTEPTSMRQPYRSAPVEPHLGGRGVTLPLASVQKPVVHHLPQDRGILREVFGLDLANKYLVHT